jgi:phage-related protein
MAIPTFTYDPITDPVGTSTYRTLTAQFGDGYSQVAGDGINNVYDTWSLSFAGASADVAPVKSFLDALQGYLPFYWTPPLGVQGLYRCGSASAGTSSTVSAPTLTASTGGNYVYTCTFQQLHHP